MGWNVFPLQPRSKVPLPGTHGFQDAGCDPEVVAGWWAETPDANVGVACGASGLLVVDLDGEEAKAAWADLAARRGGHDTTLAAATGKGLHVYFAAPPDVGWARSTAGRIAAGIDTRGQGGYVVSPPSVHPSGATYRWVYRQPPFAPARTPGWLVELLAPPPPAPAGEARPLPRGELATSYGRAALAGLCDEMLGQAEGARNDRLTRLAYRAGRLAAAGDVYAAAAAEALVAAAAIAGLPQREAAATVVRAIEAGIAAGPAAREQRTRRPR
jgi:hypothetical protein